MYDEDSQYHQHTSSIQQVVLESMADDGGRQDAHLPEAGPTTDRAQSHPAAATSAASVYRRRSAFSFPRAAQPEIVRAYQKDAFYREQLQEQLQDVVRSLLGSRVLFQHADLISFAGALVYFVLSTLGGAQTLGEEYVNAMMTNGKTGKIVQFRRRLVFIFLHIVAPFLATRLYSATRRRIVASDQQRSQTLQRARLRAQALAPRRSVQQRQDEYGQSSSSKEPQPTASDRLVGFLARILPTFDTINSSTGIFAYLGAAHLALFYLGGRYYKFSQRFSRTEYISTIARRPGQQPPSYEVLGFLLGVQLFVKTLMQANGWYATWKQQRSEQRRAAQQASSSGGEASSRAQAEEGTASGIALDGSDTVEIDGTVWSHKASPPTRISASSRADADSMPSVPLTFADPEALPSAADLGLPQTVDRAQLEAARSASKVRAAELESIAQGVLRCTLCMEQREPQRGTSAVTECGHVFCWDCIYGWTREKPECPLCRQSLDPSHLLPIYNF